MKIGGWRRCFIGSRGRLRGLMEVCGRFENMCGERGRVCKDSPTAPDSASARFGRRGHGTCRVTNCLANSSPILDHFSYCQIEISLLKDAWGLGITFPCKKSVGRGLIKLNPPSGKHVIFYEISSIFGIYKLSRIIIAVTISLDYLIWAAR
jgi:hypothetical protein